MDGGSRLMADGSLTGMGHEVEHKEKDGPGEDDFPPGPFIHGTEDTPPGSPGTGRQCEWSKAGVHGPPL